MAGFELLEHPADIGLRARGVDLAGAMAAAVAGLACISAGPGAVRNQERRIVRLQDPDPEALLVALLEECLYLGEVHGWLAGGAELRVYEGGLEGDLLGEPFDAERHQDGSAVKAITWHQLAVRHCDGYVEVVVFVDL